MYATCQNWLQKDWVWRMFESTKCLWDFMEFIEIVPLERQSRRSLCRQLSPCSQTEITKENENSARDYMLSQTQNWINKCEFVAENQHCVELAVSTKFDIITQRVLIENSSYLAANFLISTVQFLILYFSFQNQTRSEHLDCGGNCYIGQVSIRYLYLNKINWQ